MVAHYLLNDKVRATGGLSRFHFAEVARERFSTPSDETNDKLLAEDI
jgi:hypothetical protein